MRLDWQNLNERSVGGVTLKGSPLRRGRAWLWYSGRNNVGLDWCIHGSFRIGMSLGRGEKVSLSLGLILFTAYLSFPCPRRWWNCERVSEMYWHEGTLVIHPWARAMEWRAKDPWWVRGVSICPMDLIFGRRKHSDYVIDKKPVKVPLPERVYDGTVKIEHATWRRSRWPWWPLRRDRIRYEVAVEGGVPVPGKGENSWDCGDDAIHSQSSCLPRSEEAAVASFVESVLTTRRRYGGQHMSEPGKQRTPR